MLYVSGMLTLVLSYIKYTFTRISDNLSLIVNSMYFLFWCKYKYTFNTFHQSLGISLRLPS